MWVRWSIWYQWVSSSREVKVPERTARALPVTLLGLDGLVTSQTSRELGCP